MIEIEKLKQILLNHEPIWCIGLGGNVFKIGNKKKDTERLLNYYVDKYSSNNYFESEQSARWYAKFGNISRTETLSLPTWEDFCNGHKIHFCQKYINYLCSINDNRIRLLECYGMCANPLFDEPLTKENYLNACEVCRKLFLGE